MQIRLTVRDVRRVNNEDGSQYGELVRFQSVEGSDNADWAVGTPSSSLDLYITNPAAFGSFTAQEECVLEVDVQPPAAVEQPAPEPEPEPEPVPEPQPELATAEGG